MANHNLPITSSLYTDVISILKDRDDDIATMFRSQTETNQPTNSIRWEPTNKRFEIWGGATWTELLPKATDNYNISVEQLGGKTAASFLDTTSSQIKTAGSLTLQADITAPLVLKGGTVNAVYLPFYADAAAQTSLTGSIGFNVAGSRILKLITNTVSPIEFRTNGISRMFVNSTGGISIGIGSSNSEATVSDIYLEDNANIAASQNLNFYIDSNSNLTDRQFSWRHNAGATTGSSILMTLAEDGNLSLTSGFMQITSPSITALYLDQGGSAYHIQLRDGVSARWSLGAPIAEDHFKIYSYATASIAFQINYGDNNATTINTNVLNIGKDGIGSTFLKFWDDSSNAYKNLIWNDISDAFEIDTFSNTGKYKILTEEDRVFSPVVTATGTGAATLGYWFKLADVIINDSYANLNVILDLQSTDFSAYTRIHAQFRGNTGANITYTQVKVLNASEGTNHVFNNGNFKIIENSVSLGSFELWMQIGSAYTSITAYEIYLKSTGEIITYPGNSAVQATEPVGTETNFYAYKGFMMTDTEIEIGQGYPDINIKSTNLNLGDNQNFNLGTSLDLRLRHDGANSYIENLNIGAVYLDQRVNSSLGYIRADGSDSNTDTCLRWGGATPDVRLYYDNSEQLTTISNGISITNTLTISGSNSEATEADIQLTDNSNIASSQNLNFYIDSDNNQTDRQFTWRQNAKGTTGSTILMKLTEAGTLSIGSNGKGDSVLTFYDDTANTERAIFWDDSASAFFIEDSVGSLNEIIHSKGGQTINGNLTLTGEGTAIDWNATSDKRLKDNFLVVNNALEKINKISGYTFTRKKVIDTDLRYAGVIAQELQKVLPEVITKGSDGYLTVSYGGLTALLIEAIKELNEKVERLN